VFKFFLLSGARHDQLFPFGDKEMYLAPKSMSESCRVAISQELAQVFYWFGAVPECKIK